MQFNERNYRLKHEVTIGVEIASRTIFVDDLIIKLRIWDTV